MAKTKIKPLGSRILVQRQEAETSKGGILLPESAQQKPKQGVVMAVGPGKVDDQGKHHPVELKVGDEILFSSYAGTEYKAETQEFLLLNEEDVLAVLN
jgi:chaperonin GroES